MDGGTHNRSFASVLREEQMIPLNKASKIKVFFKLYYYSLLFNCIWYVLSFSIVIILPIILRYLYLSI